VMLAKLLPQLLPGLLISGRAYNISECHVELRRGISLHRFRHWLDRLKVTLTDEWARRSCATLGCTLAAPEEPLYGTAHLVVGQTKWCHS